MHTLFDRVLDAPDRRGRCWAIVLAGGDGRRLAPVACELYGYPRPKQYCAFGDDPRTLLGRTVERATLAVPRERVLVSVNREHRAELAEVSPRFPGVHWVEQPRNLGTTAGLLLPLLHVLARDPGATLLVLPSDHWISHERAFMRTLGSPQRLLDGGAQDIVLLGVDTPDLEGCGVIVPRPGAQRTWARVDCFREKPGRAEAEALRRRHGLANTFAFTARATALGRLLRARTPTVWEALSRSFYRDEELDAVYRLLPPSCFSREVLERAPEHLGVLPLTGVEWSDIGTPERLARASLRTGSCALPPTGPPGADGSGRTPATA